MAPEAPAGGNGKESKRGRPEGNEKSGEPEVGMELAWKGWFLRGSQTSTS